MLVMYGSNRSTNSRQMNVGMGSCGQDLAGDDMMMRRTSAGEHGRNDGNEQCAVLTTGGGGWPVVAAMTSSTLRAKNAAKPSAV